MKTEIILDTQAQQLILRHTTNNDYVGTVVIPTDPFSKTAYEVVMSPTGVEIHSADFPAASLGARDLEPYLVGMTHSARQLFRRVC